MRGELHLSLPSISRREALKLVGKGAVGASAGVVTGALGYELVATGVEGVEDVADWALGPETRTTHPSFEHRMQRKVPRKLDNYRAVLRTNASARVSVTDRRSRLELSQDVFDDADLPESLRELLPFVPFQESSYRLNARSNVALGPWQFIRGTAGRYGLIQNGVDRRTSITHSTEAAREYFEDIYKQLERNTHYQTLKARYSLNGDFLSMITVNAFNSGEGHMERALQVMATENAVRGEVDEHAEKGGDVGLFRYLTEVYIYDWRKYQEGTVGPPYYFKESSDYVYSILAYHQIHTGKQMFGGGEYFASLGLVEGVEDKREYVGAGFGAAALLLASKQVKGLTRRALFTKAVPNAVIGAAGGGLGAGWGWDRVRGGVASAVEKVTEFGVPEIKLPQLNNPLRNLGIGRHEDLAQQLAQQVQQRFNTLPGEDGLFASKGYVFNQRMADVAFETFQETGNEDLLVLARYYYDQALNLARAQQRGEYALPSGGQAKVTERISYIENALEVIKGEFED